MQVYSFCFVSIDFCVGLVKVRDYAEREIVEEDENETNEDAENHFEGWERWQHSKLEPLPRRHQAVVSMQTKSLASEEIHPAGFAISVVVHIYVLMWAVALDTRIWIVLRAKKIHTAERQLQSKAMEEIHFFARENRARNSG